MTTMLKLLPILLATGLFSSCKQEQPSSDITIGKIEIIHSKILDEERTVWIHVPDGGERSRKKYPVLYLMDGDAHFKSVVGLMHQLSSVNGNRICPKMIIVAILNTNRYRDLTPTKYIVKDTSDTSAPETGNGEAFTQFIAEELIPFVDKNYPTTNERTLVGHSLGGLMVINTLAKHSELFDKYLSIDPSLWWNDGESVREYEELITSKSLQGKSLFVSLANTISMDSAAALRDTSEATFHFRAAVGFLEGLQKNPNHRLDWKSKYYPTESHGSVPLISEYDAFNFLYRKIPIVMASAELKQFEGRYSHEFREGEVSFLDVVANEDHLSVTESWRNIPMKFRPISERDFYCFGERFPIHFRKNTSGDVIELIAFDDDIWTRVD